MPTAASPRTIRRFILLQVMDGRGVWRTRKRLGSVIAAESEVARSPEACAGGRLRLIEVGREPATGAPVHREVLRAAGDARTAPVGVVGGGDRDARALVSALRRTGEWAGRHPDRGDGRGRRALRAVAATAVVLTLGAALLGDAPWRAPDRGPSATAALAAALGSVLEAVRPPIELLGAALAREMAPPQTAALPVPQLAFGVSWRETLDGAIRRGLTCREASPALVACELGRPLWLHDAQSAQLLFDRRDGSLAAVVVVSRLLVDRDPRRSGLEIKRRFDELTETIEGLLPPGYTASVRTESPSGVAFWSGLRDADGRGQYAAEWMRGADASGPSVSLRLYGIDAARGFYKILVERPA